MQLDPLAEALAYRKMCNYILFHRMMSSLQNNYKHLNQAEKFFRREQERGSVILAEAYLQSMHLWTEWENCILAVWVTHLALGHQLSYTSRKRETDHASLCLKK